MVLGMGHSQFPSVVHVFRHSTAAVTLGWLEASPHPQTKEGMWERECRLRRKREIEVIHLDQYE